MNADTKDVIRSETLFTNFVAEHNLPFAVADHFTRLYKQMFPDSKIALKKFLWPNQDDEDCQKCHRSSFGRRTCETVQNWAFFIRV